MATHQAFTPPIFVPPPLHLPQLPPIITRSPDGFNMFTLRPPPIHVKPSPSMLTSLRIGNIFQNAILDINELTYLMNLFPVNQSIDINFMISTQNIIFQVLENATINNQQTYDADYIKLALFNIYDNGNFI